MPNRYTDDNPYITGERPRPTPRGRSSRDGWEVRETETAFDLFLARRVVQYDLADVEEAMRFIHRMDPEATEFVMVALDGYREKRQVT